MRSAIVILISVAVIGAVVGSILQSDGFGNRTKAAQSSAPAAMIEPRGRPSTATDNAQLMALAEQLAAEIEARKALQETVDTLSARLSQLLQDDLEADSADVESQLDTANPTTDRAWFNEQALIDAGIQETEANRIKAVYEELALERLYVRDQATREGWGGAKRREAFAALDAQQQALQEELGDDVYDAYLYASGQPNRVEVRGVLAGSAADSVGIKNGDYILSYANQRVYSGWDLRGATAEGTANEIVAVTIVRDDTRQQLYIPRGPLGIRMNSASVAPEN